MELWIRSQDKKRLIKCEKLITVEFTEKTECEIWNDEVKLGTYKTKERALEILNAIQQAMIEQSAKNERNELIGGLGFGSIPKKNVFIQMPEE